MNNNYIFLLAILGWICAAMLAGALIYTGIVLAAATEWRRCGYTWRESIKKGMADFK